MELTGGGAHNAAMRETDLFTSRIEPDPLYAGRFRWTVCEGSQIHLRSPHSYATKREAEQEADKAMQKLASTWTGKR
jgi:hypothetical protein